MSTLSSVPEEMPNKVDNPRTIPTSTLVEAYRETGSYRQAAKKLGVSVQFLHKRIKKHGGDITTKEFVNYHIMNRVQLEEHIQALINQQIKSVFDELESELDDGKNSHSMKVISSAIQKIRSRYE